MFIVYLVFSNYCLHAFSQNLSTVKRDACNY